ncbi:MAG: flagellar biosynthesis anti-sigma factor FlgM [bacterium]
MNSKIGGVLSVNKMLVSENRHQGKPNGSPAGGAKGKAGVAGEDSVVLTEAARKLVDAEMEVASSPVVDRARIEEIKNAIAQGSFKPNAEKIASKLIELEMGFLD